MLQVMRPPSLPRPSAPPPLPPPADEPAAPPLPPPADDDFVDEAEAAEFRAAWEAPLSDEALALMLQAQDQQTTSAARHVDGVSDEEIARLLQAQEEDHQDTNWQSAMPAARSTPVPSAPSPPPPDCTACLPLVAAFLSSGAFFGCATALQVAAMLGLGNCSSAVCALGGGLAGHAAAAAPPPGGRQHRLRREPQGEGEWQWPGSEAEEQAPPQRGLGRSVIEDHSASHTFAGPSGAASASAPGGAGGRAAVAAGAGTAAGGGGGGMEEALQCMVCMEDFVVGDKLRTLPCLHRYHQSCIDEWLCRSPECPICKRNITELDLPPDSPPRGRTSSSASRGSGVGARLSRSAGRLFRRRPGF